VFSISDQGINALCFVMLSLLEWELDHSGLAACEAELDVFRNDPSTLFGHPTTTRPRLLTTLAIALRLANPLPNRSDRPIGCYRASTHAPHPPYTSRWPPRELTYGSTLSIPPVPSLTSTGTPLVSFGLRCHLRCHASSFNLLARPDGSRKGRMGPQGESDIRSKGRIQ
jgi:hypothetical protein